MNKLWERNGQFGTYWSEGSRQPHNLDGDAEQHCTPQLVSLGSGQLLG